MNPDTLAGGPALARLTGLLSQDTRAGEDVRAELAAVLAGVTLEELVHAKLGYPLLHLADRWGIGLTDAQAAELARLRRREAVMNAELGEVADALAGGPCEYLLMRGPALTRFYPEGWVRQYNDLDILVRNERSVPEVLSRLARRGYYVARPVVSRATAAGTWLGIALNKRVSGLGHPMYLDVTSLGPALSSTRNLTLPSAVWRTLDTVGVNEARIPVLPRDWQAALFAVELAERRGSFVLRDVLDLAMLDRSSPDWSAVRSRLRGFAEAAAALGAVARLGRDCGRAADGTTGAAGPLAVTWPAPRRRPPGPRAVAAATVSTLIGRAKRRSPVLARWMAERAPARLWFALGLPVYLLPPWSVPLRGADGRRLAGLPGYRGRVYPLVPPGYTQAVFAPRSREVADR